MTSGSSGGGNELGGFLRSRRERVDAEAAGVVGHVRRRVPGLRREELALLAGVSPSYYTRLEQGRDRNPSREVLSALARVLGLDDTERAYLWSLAAPALEPAGGARPAGRAVRPGAELLLRRCADLPAFVTAPDREVLAATEVAGRVNPAWRAGGNPVEFAFLDPRARQVYPEWDTVAGQAVAGLRATAAARRPELDGFVARLRAASGEFRERWDAHDVYARTEGAKRIAVEGVGELLLEYDTFALSGDEGQTLYVYFPRPGSPDEELLRGLR